jgi:hypothetical protein
MGTAASEYILNVEVNGTVYGEESAVGLPRGFARNAVAAKALRVEMEKLFDKEGSTVIVDSSEPEFAGNWTIGRIRFSPGRFGQIILNLNDDINHRRAEIWSYRHSSCVNSVTLA